MLVQLNLYNNLDDPSKKYKIAACTADLEAYEEREFPSLVTNATCQQIAENQTNITLPLQLASSGSSSSTQVSNVVAALSQLQTFLSLSETSCDDIIELAYSGDIAIGIYVGSALASQGVILSVLEQLSSHLQADGSVAENLLVQLTDDLTARYSLGVFIKTLPDLVSVQQSLRVWRNGSSIASTDETTSAWQDIIFFCPFHLEQYYE